jgi:hypothetical protein
LLPLIISLVGLLLIVLIGYNVIQQYKQKAEVEKRISITKQHAIISEVDELLQLATKIPFSKMLMLILKNRIRNALLMMINISPGTNAYKEHFSDTEAQIKQIKDNYTAPNASEFPLPSNDNEGLALVQATKKLRAVLRSEHTRGKVNTNIFVAENRQLELIQLKINLKNSLKRVSDAKSNKQYDTAKQMIEKILRILESIPDKDNDLLQQQQFLIEEEQQVLAYIKANPDAPQTSIDINRIINEDKKKKERDMIFGDKQKW